MDDHQPLPASEQGVYTCRIPLQSGEIRDINIGIYPIGFNSESYNSFATTSRWMDLCNYSIA